MLITPKVCDVSWYEIRLQHGAARGSYKKQGSEFKNMIVQYVSENLTYSGTSTGQGKSDLNGEVTVTQGLRPILYTMETNLGLCNGDLSSEVTVRRGSAVHAYFKNWAKH